MKFNNFQFLILNKKRGLACRQAGFTLIESLVVVTMLMVIVAVGATSYSTASKKNRDNKRMADLDRIRMALEMFRQNDVGGSYPASISSLVPTYLDVVPIGPKGSGVGDTYLYTPGSPRYTYTLKTIPLESTGVGYSVTNP